MELPEDIIREAKSLYPRQQDFDQAVSLLSATYQASANVGPDQLNRAMLIIAKGDLSKLKAIVDSGYYGDPRDVIMAAMATSGHDNH